MFNIAHSGEATGAEIHGKARTHASGLQMAIAANRSMNVSIAVIALLFFLPMMILVAMAIWCQDRGPVFFAHKRIGRDGLKFPCLKFRSMAIDAQERLQELLANDAQARAEWERDHKLRNDP